MSNIKKTLKNIIPDFILMFVTGLFYGWRGNYSSWQQAKMHCSGYDSPAILEKVKFSALKVKNKQAVFERDSAIFDHIEYSFPVLTGLLWISAQNKGKLHVLDFGGSLGSSYYQNKKFIQSLDELKWCIVEQANFVIEGQKNFSDEILKFYESIDMCLIDNQIDVILLSSVIQYIEKPYDLLEKIKSKKFRYIIFDRTSFVKGNDRITVQKVHPLLYSASYPCWFFNETKFLNFMKTNYELILSFDAIDKANIISKFKGFIFKIK